MYKVVTAALAGSAAALALLGTAACVPPAVTAPEQTEPAPAPQTEQEPAPAPEEEVPAPAPDVVTSNTDGVFSYEITSSGETDVFYDVFGDTYYPDEDKFFTTEITATNETTAPATAPDPWILDHVVAIDSEGRVHQADDEPWTDSLSANPGSSVSYAAAWDLPADVTIEYVELATYDATGVAVIEVK